MSSLSYSPLVKEEEVCWTEKEGMLVNSVVEEDVITVKEEDEEKDAVFGVGKEEAATVKEEEEDVTVKEEEEDVTVKEEKEPFGEEEQDISKEEDEVVLGVKEDVTEDLINTRERPDSHSDSGKSPSGDPDPETSKPARRHHYCHCGKSFWWLGTLETIRECT
uniref:histone chaperone ASF1-like n=1 Tax=Oncorhynchus gorbuscha TaxID=8017 RepID=UPI001EAF3E8D|nr:histone chaperone ASF1-like [Oncorhynchus gorbuscha]